MKRLRIVMLVSSDLDVDPRVQKEARAAHLAGHEVTVICRFASLDFPYCVVPIQSKKTNSKSVVARVLDRIQFMLRCVARSPSRMDLVHANDLDMLPIGWLLARKAGAALVYDSHESWTDLERGIPKLGLRGLTWLEGVLCRRTDAVVTVSEPIADSLAADYRIDRPTVVLNAPEYVRVSCRQPSATAVTPSTVSPHRLVLFHGLYRANSGLEELVRSAPYLSAGITIGLRGYGPLEAGLRSLTTDLGVHERVKFFDPVPIDALVSSASTADLGIIPLLPKTRQNLGAGPNKLFQYLMAGLPVATSRIPTLEAILSSHGVGRSFDIYDPRDVAECIDAMLEPEAYEQAKRNALAAARTLNWEHEYPKLEVVYQRVVGG